MGALGHYLESAGLATTQISLIREHSEAIRPPRALWVPFELGRPLGVAEDPPFQHRVLGAALALLEADKGPILVDFAEEAQVGDISGDEQPAVWACPVNLGDYRTNPPASDQLTAAFLEEVRQLRPWYELRRQRMDRTAMVEFNPDSAARFLTAFVAGRHGADPAPDLPLAVAVRLAAQDVKAFYFEATTAQPGATAPSSAAFNRWFWQETAASRVLSAVKERCLNQDDPALRTVGAMLLVPLGQP